MEKLIKKYRDRLWWAATGEGPATAFRSVLDHIEGELRKFALEITKECGACISEPKE